MFGTLTQFKLSTNAKAVPASVLDREGSKKDEIINVYMHHLLRAPYTTNQHIYKDRFVKREVKIKDSTKCV